MSDLSDNDVRTSAAARGSGRNRLVRRVVVPLALLACLAGLAYTAFNADTEKTDISVSSNEALDALVPTRGAEILSQDIVGVDLAFGWDASLSVNGTPIPADQTEHEAARNWVFFRPGPGQAVVALDENTNCAEAVIWRTVEGPEKARPPVRWCFEVT